MDQADDSRHASAGAPPTGEPAQPNADTGCDVGAEDHSLRPNGRLARPAESAPPSATDAQAHFLDRTLQRWQPRAPRPLTREDARRMVENVTGFFRVLQDWAFAERPLDPRAAEHEPSNVTRADGRQAAGARPR